MRQLLTWMVIPLCVVLLTTVVVWFWLPQVAPLISTFGTLAVTLTALGFIVLFDSKRRWPDVPMLVRMGRVLTFYR